MLIGIDADVEKNGVATKIDDSETFILSNLTFFELFEYLKEQKENTQSLKVYIEAGWLNKSNWHIRKGFSANYNAKIGGKTERNHEVGRKIAEMCEYLKIEFELVRPIKSKLNAEAFKNLTKYPKRTNQEQRDAAMLVFGR